MLESRAAIGEGNFAFAWLLNQPGVIPIAGPSKRHHMEAIEEALGLQLSETDLDRLSAL